MTSSDHGRILAIAHLAYGAVSALGVLAVASAIIGAIGFAALSRYLIPDHSGLTLVSNDRRRRIMFGRVK